jgi:predicted helicase
LLPALTEAYHRKPTPEEVFHYVYAVLYSPPYREKHDQFLKGDFPRIPFPAETAAFRSMTALGAELTALHLLRSPALDSAIAGFHGKGDNQVASHKIAGRTYDPKAGRVYVNREQYFDAIPEGLWNCQIGGYQVLDKWLDDRAERRLSADDVRHYCRVAMALAETLRIQKQLTDIYPDVEKHVLVFEKWKT